MECASLCWMSASSTTLQLLDSIQNKALRIIGVDAQQARTQLNIFPLHHRRLVAASTLIYKMNTSQCPTDLKLMLPSPCDQTSNPIQSVDARSCTYRAYFKNTFCWQNFHPYCSHSVEWAPGRHSWRVFRQRHPVFQSLSASIPFICLM